MRSTGEVMGIAPDFPTAFAKAQAAAGAALPNGGTVFITVTDSDKAGAVAIAQTLHDLGFRIVATRGTSEAIERMGIPAVAIKKLGEGSPNVVDWIESGEVDLVVNTPTGSGARTDGWEIRRAAVARGIPCLTTLSGGPGRGARDRRRAPGRAGGGLAAGGPRDDAPGGARVTRTQAPFGRRELTVAARRELGAYVILTAPDPAGPRPQAGQFYMLAAATRWGGGADERPFLPRAFSVARADGGGLHFMLEDVGPGTDRLCALAPGDGLLVTGPLGGGFAAAATTGRRALLCGGGVGTAPLAIWQDELLAAGERAPALLGFRDGAHAPGAELLANARVATDDGSARPPRPRHRPARRRARRRRPRHGLRLRPAARCSRRCARLCRERGVPSQLALESGMACGFGACFGCVVPLAGGGYARLCVDGPVLDGDAIAEVPAH